jgi:hypothetical protein
MATAGNFPKDIGDTIFLADYNAIQSVISGVLGGYYYSSSGSALPKTGTPAISASDMDNLRLDINTGWKHITGSNSSLSDKAVGDLIEIADWNAYKTAADYVETNKATVHPTQLSSTVLNQTLTTSWNGLHTWTQTFTWATTTAAARFFNTGGYFVCDVSGSNSSGSNKDIDWQDNILNAIPTQTYAKTQWDAGTAIDVYEYGNTSQYVENYARIQITKSSNASLTISVTINDADVGDQTGTGPAVDEDVNTDAAATITRYVSIDAVPAEDPVVTLNSSW